MQENRVTVILPVFNGYSYVKNCLQSLADHLADVHQVYIIDDCSDDDKVIDLLESFAQEKENFHYFRNEKNLGFVKACNKAVLEIDKSSRDILLLNSDTIVTEGFLEELLAVLYLHDRHAAVSPRSNNATLHSVPINKQLEARESHHVWQKLRSVITRYNIVPTCVGFCVLIRRSIIQNFGFFDEIYSPGYNEENDLFCCINRIGYSTVQANHAYVFHMGSASFSNAKAELEKKNSQVLTKRYPEYTRKVTDYFNYGVSAVDRFADVLFQEQEPKLLYYLSDLQPRRNGTSILAIEYWKFIKEELADHFSLHIYIPKESYDFFGSELSCENVYFTGAPISEGFHLGFKPSQIFSMKDFYLFSSLCVKLVFNLLDIISIRCSYFKAIGREIAVEQSLKWSDKVISISDYTSKDTLMYFSNNEVQQPQTIYPVFSELEQSQIIATDSILLIGNKFAHKVINETLHVIGHLGIQISVLGEESANFNFPSDLITFFPSGTLSEDKVKSLYQNCSVVVYPSQYEGFGLPLVEAHNLNKPIICFDSAVSHELERNLSLSNIFYYTSFSELKELVKSVLSLSNLEKSHKLEYSVQNNIKKIILELNDDPVNYQFLNERHRNLSEYAIMEDVGQDRYGAFDLELFPVFLRLQKLFNLRGAKKVLKLVRWLFKRFKSFL